MFLLGQMYEKGLGVEQSYSKAVELYVDSVDDDKEFEEALDKLYPTLRSEKIVVDDERIHHLGMLYWEGSYHIEESSETAFKWFLLSAELGNASAQYNLGWMYEYGNGVEQSYEEAVKWYKRSAEQGSAMAQNSSS